MTRPPLSARSLLLLSILLGAAPPLTAETILFGLTNQWKYEQTTNLDQVGWQEVSYDDSTWPSGPGLLYVEDNTGVSPRNTPLVLGRITYYFRTRFDFPYPPSGSLLTFSNLIDDGAVFYLNGVEMRRIRMPSEPAEIRYATLASGTPSGTDATSFDVFTLTVAALTNLVQGQNVLAVAVHQQAAGSSDIVFGCALSRLEAPPPPVWTLQPTNLVVFEGDTVVLRAVAEGNPAPVYQWFKDDQALPGITSADLTIRSAVPLDSGSYQVRATSAGGQITSLPATLTVVPDLDPPRLMGALADKQLTHILVSFSESLAQSATHLAGFEVRDVNPSGHPLQVLGAQLTNGTNVLLTTAPRVPGVHYALTVTGVADNSVAHNVIRPGNGVAMRYQVDLIALDHPGWRYFAEGGWPDPNWAQPAFDHSSWAAGAPLFHAGYTWAPLPEPIRTSLSLSNPAGPGQLISYYFRARFDVPGLVEPGSLRLRHVIDDGATVYLNGAEVYSLRMPSLRPLQYPDFAASPVDTPSYEPPLTEPGTVLAVTNLVMADNLLAVEVHQASASSSEMAFGLGLEAVITQFTCQPVLHLPTVIAENAGPLPQAARISIQQPQPAALRFELTSSDTHRLQVPATVVLPAGELEVVFDLMPVDDAGLNGTVRIEVEAWSDGSKLAGAGLRLLDNETATLRLLVPGTVTEGQAPVPGWLTLVPAPSAPLWVELRPSSPEARVQPEAVLVSAGQTSAVFQVGFVDDRLLNGPRQFTLTASLPGSEEAVLSVGVEDDERAVLHLALPPRLREGDGVRTNAGQVWIEGLLGTSLTVSLATDQTTDLRLPAVVTISAGETNALFDLEVLDDTLTDGARLALVCAIAPGFTATTNSVLVGDNDLHHVQFSSVSFLQYQDRPFSVTLTAQTADGERLTDFSGSVPLAAVGRDGPVSLSPAACGPFAQGRWTGNITVLATGWLVRLQPVDLAGRSDPFHVQPWPFRVLAVQVEDLLYDPRGQVVLASGAGSPPTNQDALLVIDPLTATITNAYPLSFPPGQMEISPDGQSCFVSLNSGAILQRFDLVRRTLGLSLNVGSLANGPWWATDFAFVGGQPDSVVVSVTSSSAFGRLHRYDGTNGTRLSLPAYPTLLAGLPATPTLFGFAPDSHPPVLARIVFKPWVECTKGTNLMAEPGRNFIASGGSFYAESGEVVQADTFSLVGRYPASGPVVVAEDLNRTLFLEHPSASQWRVAVFDQASFEGVCSLSLPPVTGSPKRFLRCGGGGLVFNTTAGEIWLVNSGLLLPAGLPADVSLRHSLLSQPPLVGSNVAYRITLTNSGPGDATFIAVSNCLPTDTMVTSLRVSTGTISQVSGILQWMVHELPAGAAATLDFFAVHAHPGWHEQVAQAVAYQADRVWSNNRSRLGSYVQLPSGYASTIAFEMNVADMLYDPARDRLLLALGPSAQSQSNSLAVFNGQTGLVESYTPLGARPDRLAASDQGEYLYVSLPDQWLVRRYDLPTLTSNLQFSPGQETSGGSPSPVAAMDMAVLPGQPRSVAIVRHSKPPEGIEYPVGIAVFDDATMRPSITSVGQQYAIEFGPDASRLCALLIASESHEFGEYQVDATGIHFTRWTSFLGRGLDLRFANGLFYTSAGRAVDPQEQRSVGIFPGAVAVAVVPDPVLGHVFFLQQDGAVCTVRAYSLDDYTLTKSITVENVVGTASRLTRWGLDGLAFRTSSNQLFLTHSGLRPPEQRPDLVLAQSTLPAVGQLGGSLLFTTTITNIGPGPAQGVLFTNTFRPVVRVLGTQPARGSCQASNGMVVCDLGDLPVGTGVSITVVTVPQNTNAITSIACAAAAVDDAAPENNFALSLTPVGGPADQQASQVLALSVRDLVYAPQHEKIIASLTEDQAGLRNALLLIDPASGETTPATHAGPEPNQLAVSDDGQELYVGIYDAVRRFHLPGLTPGERFSLSEGPYGSTSTLQALAVQPGNNSVVAAGNSVEVALYDRGLRRTNAVPLGCRALEFAADASTLLGLQGPFYRTDLSRLQANQTGVSLADTIPVVELFFPTPDIKFEGDRAYLPGGQVVDVGGLSVLSTLPGLPADSVVETDPSNRRVYYLARTGSDWSLRAFDTTTSMLIGTNLIQGVLGLPSSLVCCGANRLAFRTDSGQVFLLHTPLAPSDPPADLRLTLSPTTNRVLAGESVAFRAAVANAGPNAASNVTLFFKLPPNARPLAVGLSQGNFSVTGSEVRVSLGRLVPGQNATVAVQVQAEVAGGVTATASLFSAALDLEPANNQATAQVSARVKLGPDAIAEVALAAQELVCDPWRGRIYAAGPGSSISAVDPTDASVETLILLPNQPAELALSDDGQFLYFGLSNGLAIARLDLETRTITLQFGLDFELGDLEVIPGHARSVVGTSRITWLNKMYVYDDGIPRLRCFGGGNGAMFLEFGATSNILHVLGVALTGWPYFRSVEIDSLGLHERAWPTNVGAAWCDIRFDAGLLYAGRGDIVDPARALVVAHIPDLGDGSRVEPEVAKNRVFCLAQTGAVWTLRAHDAATLGLIGSRELSGVQGTPTSFVRWGSDGLAFSTSGGQLYLIRTPLRPSGPSTDLAVSQWAPAPVVVGDNLTLTVTVTNRGPHTASGVVLTHQLPPALRFLSATATLGTCSHQQGIVACRIGVLTNGEYAQCSFVVTATAAGRLPNVASVTSSTLEANPADNICTVDAGVRIAPEPDSVNLVVQDQDHLLYDPVSERLYATFSKRLSAAGPGILSFDPATAQTDPPLWLQSDPNFPAVAAGGRSLYVVLDQGLTVRRLRLPGLTPDLEFDLGLSENGSSRRVVDLAVSPADPDTLALVFLGWPAESGKPYGLWLGIYDHGVGRPVLDGFTEYMTFVSPSVIMGYPSNRLLVESNGVRCASTQSYRLTGQLKADAGLLFTSAGLVFNADVFTVMNTFPPCHLIEPDVRAGRLYCLTRVYPDWILRVIETGAYTEVGSSIVIGLAGTPHSLVRCGGDRLAIGTDAGQILILRSSLVPADPGADLAVSQSSTGPVMVGSNLTFTIAVTNHGPASASQVVLADKIPPQFTFIAAQSNDGVCTQKADQVTCAIARLDRGQGAAMTVTVCPAQGGAFVNLATANSAATDPNLSNNLSRLMAEVLISPSPDSITRLAQPTTRLVHEPVSGQLYAVVPPPGGALGSRVVAVDPANGRVQELVGFESPADLLAVTDNGQYLYVGFGGEGVIQRLNLATGRTDLRISLGTNEQGTSFGLVDLAAVPGEPESVAVANSDSTVLIYDGQVPRPQTVAGLRRLGFASPDVLLASDWSQWGCFSCIVGRLQLDNQGVTLITNVFYNFWGDFEVAGGRVFTTAGRVHDAGNMGMIGVVAASIVLEPDAEIERVYCLIQEGSQGLLKCYETGAYQELGSVLITQIQGTAHTLVRGGADRLALATTGGEILILRSALAPPGPPTDLAVGLWEEADPVWAGQELTCRLSITNLGPHALTNVWCTGGFTLPVELRALESSAGVCSNQTSALRCQLGALAPGQQTTLSVRFVPLVSGLLLFTNQVGGELADVIMVNNSAPALITVLPSNSIPTTLQYAIPAGDLAYDPSRDALYASVPAAFRPAPNSLLKIDTATGAIDRLLSFPGEPCLLAISSDQRYLYVCFPVQNRVRRIDLETLQVDLLFQTPGTLYDLAVQPGRPGMLVGAFRHVGVVAFEQGVELPAKVDSPRSTRLEFSADGSVLYSYDGSTTASSLSRFQIHDGGVRLIGYQDHALDAWNADIREAAGTVYAATGQAVNPNTGQSCGSFTPGSSLAVDALNNRLFSISSQRMVVHERTSLAPLGHHDFTDCRGDAYALTVCGHDRLAWLSSAGQILLARRIPAADLDLAASALAPVVLAGAPLTSTVTVSNAGPWTSSQVTLTNHLPGLSRLQSVNVSRGTWTVTSNQVVWTVGSLALSASASAAWTFVPTNQASATLTNALVIESTLPDPDPANNSANLTTLVQADNDRDQIADDWEVAHGLNPSDPADAAADPDRDGLTNRQEYWAGTDPLDPSDVLRLLRIRIATTDVWLQFQGTPGRRYLLERQETLLAPWHPVQTFQLGQERLIELGDPLGASVPQRFYRVRQASSPEF